MLQFAVIARQSSDCTAVETREHAERIKSALNDCYGDNYSYVRHASELPIEYSDILEPVQVEVH